MRLIIALTGGGWTSFVGCRGGRWRSSAISSGLSVGMRSAIGAVGKTIRAVWAGDFHFFAERGFEFVANVFVFLEEDASVLAALAHAFAGVADPVAGLFQDAFVDAEVDQIAFAGDAFAVENIEFGFAERRGDFVLYVFGASARADHAITFLDGL